MTFQLEANQGDDFDMTGWTWKPIASLCGQLDRMLDLGLRIRGRAWFYNDGDGLEDQPACTKLANALATFLKTMKPGMVLVWTSQRIAELRKTKVVTVKKRLADNAVAVEEQLVGYPNEHYYAERSEIVSFVKFLKTCGGFEIS